MTIDDEVKIIGFDRIMEHLKVAINDPRKREQLRARTALRWIEEGMKEEYDKRRNQA